MSTRLDDLDKINKRIAIIEDRQQHTTEEVAKVILTSSFHKEALQDLKGSVEALHSRISSSEKRILDKIDTLLTRT